MIVCNKIGYFLVLVFFQLIFLFVGTKDPVLKTPEQTRDGTGIDLAWEAAENKNFPVGEYKIYVQAYDATGAEVIVCAHVSYSIRNLK